MMGLASISTNIASSTSAVSRNIPARKSLFVRLLDALHHSRHLQAQRVLGQYRHLIASNQRADTASNCGGETDVGH
jgi:hypothetical protein